LPPTDSITNGFTVIDGFSNDLAKSLPINFEKDNLILFDFSIIDLLNLFSFGEDSYRLPPHVHVPGT
jgi:hypothetical protein